MSDETSLLDRGIAIMEYRKRMAPIFTDPEGAIKAKVDFDNKLKRGKKRAVQKFLATLEDDEE